MDDLVVENRVQVLQGEKTPPKSVTEFCTNFPVKINLFKVKIDLFKLIFSLCIYILILLIYHRLENFEPCIHENLSAFIKIYLHSCYELVEVTK